MNPLAVIIFTGGGLLIGSGIWLVYKWKTVAGIILILVGLFLVAIPFLVSFLLAN